MNEQLDQEWSAIALITVVITVVLSLIFMYLTWWIFTDLPPLKEHISFLFNIIGEFRFGVYDSYDIYVRYMSSHDLWTDLKIHTIIPIIISLPIAFYLSIKLIWVNGGLNADTHLSGPKLYRGDEAYEHAKKQFKNDNKKQKLSSIYLCERVKIPNNMEVGNIFINGAQGSGKSVIVKTVTSQLLNRGDKSIIYDAKREYTELFLSERVLLISPSDARSVAWDIASDITTPEIAYSISECFITEKTNDKFWTDGARLILTGCFICLMNNKKEWTWSDLDGMLNKSNEELKNNFNQYYPKASKLISEDSKTTDGFMSVLATQLSWLSFVKKAWNNDNTNKFSIRNWLNTDNSINSIIIPHDPKQSLISAPLCTAFLAVIVSEVLSMPDDSNRRLWFVLDELADLPKSSYLERWLSLGRSKGARTIAGTQNISQIANIYGERSAQTILSLFSISISLRIGSSYDSAKVSSKNLGSRIVRRLNVTYDRNGNQSRNFHQIEEPLVRPEDLMQLDGPDSYGVHGYLCISGWNSVYRLVWKYISLRKVADSFVPAVFDIKNSDQEIHRTRGTRGRYR